MCRSPCTSKQCGRETVAPDDNRRSAPSRARSRVVIRPGETIVPLKPKSQSQPHEAPAARSSPEIPPQTDGDESKAPAATEK